jgi:hypothetical protein
LVTVTLWPREKPMARLANSRPPKLPVGSAPPSIKSGASGASVARAKAALAAMTRKSPTAIGEKLPAKTLSESSSTSGCPGSPLEPTSSLTRPAQKAAGNSKVAVKPALPSVTCSDERAPE